MRGVRKFEPNQNILAFARFRALSTTCASISFPFSLKDVSCLSRFLATLCWKWTPSPAMSLKRHHWYCSIYLPVFDCPRALKNTLAGLSLVKGSTISLCFIAKVYSCSGQFGANYSHHSIRQVQSSCAFFPASLDIKSPNLLKCQRQKEVSKYWQHLPPKNLILPDTWLFYTPISRTLCRSIMHPDYETLMHL